jgi:hypothetical protein
MVWWKINMPAYARKIPGKMRWRVKDVRGKIHAKSTTKKRAEAQVRLLNSLKNHR